MNVPKVLRIGMAVSLLLAPWSTPVWAAMASATTTVNLTVPARLTGTLEVGPSSAGKIGTVDFTTVDDQDTVGGSPRVMYAPVRSASMKNWHQLRVQSSVPFALSASVSGTAGTKPLTDVLDVFFGGFFNDAFGDQGGRSSDWESLSTFKRSMPKPFYGVLPFNYRARIDEVAAGSYSGTITFTLTST